MPAASDPAKELRTLAEEALRLDAGNVKKTAPKLARQLADQAKHSLLVALVADYLARLTRFPVRPASRRRQGPHRRVAVVGTPSPRAKAGAIAAMKLATAEIFKRRIRGAGELGSIQMHELRAIAESQARTAGDFLQRGYDDAVEAIALVALSGYAVAADPFAKVVDVIPAKVAEQAFKDAKLKAAEVIRDGSARVAQDLIAAARGNALIEGNETRQ